MNILVSSAILALAIILLADSIRQLAPRNKHKKRKSVSKPQPMTRANRSVIDLRMTDLRKKD